jgi:Tle cognate immunity protein 4 C-terminal domain/Tle cognate immunity protein 4 N-terminal domain
VTLSACQPELKTMKLSTEESQRVTQLTAQLVPRCIGRYMVDLPAVFVLSPVGKARIEETEIKIEPMSRSAFDQMVLTRHESLKNERTYGGNENTLKSATVLPENQGMVFDRAKTPSSNYFRVIELRAWRAGFSIEMLVDAVDGAHSRDRLDPGPTTTPQKNAELLRLLDRTRGRADSEIPIESGVCFGNGFVRGPATPLEWLQINYQLKDAEDGYFGFASLSDVGPEKTSLLDRGKSIEIELAESKGRTIRKGSRQTNGLAYEEWLSQRQSDRSTAWYRLLLEMNSKQGSAMAPLFRLDFNVGIGHPRLQESLDQSASRKPIEKPVFSEAETVAIWDTVTPSLRARPNGF